jgi:tetratricopeptide (TPR) repeat protein
MKTKPTSKRILRVVAAAVLIFSNALVRADASSALDEARAAFRAKDFDRAVGLLEPLTKEGTRQAAAFHLLSQIRLAQKDTKGAVEMAEKAARLDATKAAYFSQLGLALGTRMGEVGFMQQAMMAGKLKQAFSTAVELDPNDVAALIGLSRYYSNAPEIAGGSLTKAKELAERVQRIDPFLGAVELAGVAERAENFTEALLHYETAAQLRPNAAGLEHQCGRILAKLGRIDDARLRYEAALKIDPQFEPATKGLAELTSGRAASPSEGAAASSHAE